MSEKPEALRIADELLALHGPTEIDERAAAELRRQHDEIDQLREQNTILDATCTKLDMVRDELLEHLEAEKSVCREGVRRIAELTTQRDELLALLDDACWVLDVIIHDAPAGEFSDARSLLPRIRAAIAKAEGEMIHPDRIHDLAKRTAQRFVNDENPDLRLYVLEGRHLLDLAHALQNELLDEVLARLQQGFGTASAPVTTIRRHFAAQFLPPDDTEGGEL